MKLHVIPSDNNEALVESYGSDLLPPQIFNNLQLGALCHDPQ